MKELISAEVQGERKKQLPAVRPGTFSFSLFGQFRAMTSLGDLISVGGRKVQELIACLLLFRGRAHQRALLAANLWGESTTAQSRKCLRQSLWELRKTTSPCSQCGQSLLLVEPNWVRVDDSCVWLDVADFQDLWSRFSNVDGERLTDEQAASLNAGIALYGGDLLEGWYQDWVIHERERLRAMYLTLLEKLLGHCEATGKAEDGLGYGALLIRQEPAHERTHWRLMRLHYRSGDRTTALRQFEKCQTALADELGIGPGKRIRQLYEEICADQVASLTPNRELSSEQRTTDILTSEPENARNDVVLES